MTRRVHVCFDGVLDAAKSGGWRVFTSTLRALAKLGTLQLSAIIPDNRSGDFADIRGVDFVPVPVYPTNPLRNIVWHATTLPGLVRRLDPDVLHVPTHNLLIARRVCPTVLTVHDITEFHLRGHYDPLRMLYRHLVVPRNARLADRIVTVSEWVGRDIAATLDVSPGRIVVAPNGVDPTFRPVPAAEAAARTRRECGIEPPYLLYVGQIHMPNKNLVRLVHAFARAQKRLPEGTRLVLAGRDVSGGDQVRSAVAELSLGDAVRHVGYVPDGMLPSLYSGALAFCYPSLHEGFGLPVIEAMSCGTPVVTSDSTALAEVGRGAAILVNPLDVDAMAEAIRVAATERERRHALREDGLARAARYTWDITANILAETYATLAR